MVRTQIALDPDAHRRARGKAAKLGISLAEYIRRLVARDLEAETATASDVEDAFDLGDGGPTDVARDLDFLVGEATAQGGSGA